MQAILLASGSNTRVQHLFPNLPKVMFPLDQKPYLEYWLNILLPQKTEVIILVQYLSDVIKEYIEKNYSEELKNGKIKIIDRPENLGPVRAIAGLKEIITGDFAIFYCDVLFNINLSNAQKSLRDQFLGLTFLTTDKLHMFDKMEMQIDHTEKLVTQFQPDGYEHADGWMDVGQIYKKEVLNLFDNASDVAEHFNVAVWPQLIEDKKLTYHKVGPVFDIGTEKNYLATREIFAREGLGALDA